MLCLSGNSALALKLCLTSDSSSDQSFVGGTFVFSCNIYIYIYIGYDSIDTESVALGDIQFLACVIINHWYKGPMIIRNWQLPSTVDLVSQLS